MIGEMTERIPRPIARCRVISLGLGFSQRDGQESSASIEAVESPQIITSPARILIVRPGYFGITSVNECPRLIIAEFTFLKRVFLVIATSFVLPPKCAGCALRDKTKKPPSGGMNFRLMKYLNHKKNTAIGR